MTIGEATTLLVEQIEATRAARAERDAWRLVAQRAIHFAHEQGVELDRVRAAHRRLLDEHRSFRQQREAA